MDEERMLPRAVKTMYENPRAGDLLMDAPKVATWSELREKAKEKDEWRQSVREIKDCIYINTLGKKQKKRKGEKKVNEEGEKRKRENEYEGETSAAKDVAVTEVDGDDDDDEDDEENSWT